MAQKYRWNLDNISKSSSESEDCGLTIGEWHITSALLAIAERLEAQVTVMQKILEAVKGLTPISNQDFYIKGFWRNRQPKNPPDNLGPCGGE